MPIVFAKPILPTNGNDSFTKLLVHSNTTNGSTTVANSAAGISGPHPMSMLNGATHSTAQAKFGTSSMKLIGDTTSTINATDNGDYTLAAQDFAIDAWVRYLDLSTGTWGSHWSSGNPFSSAWIANLDIANSAATFWYTTDGDGNTGQPNAYTLSSGNGTFTPVINTWYHMAISRQGADLRFFVDGTQVGTTQNIGTHNIWNSTEPVRLGSLEVNNGIWSPSTLNGYIDEFRLSIGTPRYTGNFTPETAPYTP